MLTTDTTYSRTAALMVVGAVLLADPVTPAKRTVAVANQRGCIRNRHNEVSCGYAAGDVYHCKRRGYRLLLSRYGETLGYASRKDFTVYRGSEEDAPPGPGERCTLRASLTAASCDPRRDAFDPDNIAVLLPEGQPVVARSRLCEGPVAGKRSTKCVVMVKDERGKQVWIPIKALRQSTEADERVEFDRAYRFMKGAGIDVPPEAEDHYRHGDPISAVRTILSSRDEGGTASQVNELLRQIQQIVGRSALRGEWSNAIDEAEGALNRGEAGLQHVRLLREAEEKAKTFRDEIHRCQKRWRSLEHWWGERRDQAQWRQRDRYESAVTEWRHFERLWRDQAHRTDARTLTDLAKAALRRASGIMEAGAEGPKLSLRPSPAVTYRSGVRITFQLLADSNVRLLAFRNDEPIGAEDVPLFAAVDPRRVAPPPPHGMGPVIMKGGKAAPRPGKPIVVRRQRREPGARKAFMQALCHVNVTRLRLGRNRVRLKADGTQVEACATVYRHPYRRLHVAAIGCSASRDDRLEALGYAARDAVDFAILALRRWQVPSNCIALFLDRSSLDSLDDLVRESCEKHGWRDTADLVQALKAAAGEARLSHVRQTLDAWGPLGSRGEDGVHAKDGIVLFISTHGVLRHNGDNGDKLRFVMSDSTGRGHFGAKPGLSADYLLGWAATVKAEHLLVILDACHSGRVVRTRTERYEDQTPETLVSHRARNVIASCQGDAQTPEIAGNGLLTHHLIQTLTSHTDCAELDKDRDGWLSFAEVAQALQRCEGLEDMVHGCMAEGSGQFYIPAGPLPERCWGAK